MNQTTTFGASRALIPSGTQLNGIYEIDEPIAAGGMGEIYRGHTIQTGDAVAIKLIRSDLAESEAAFALFRKEASSLHNLYHDAIVRYYVFTIDPILERPYLAMEFVDGKSLSAMLRGGPLAFEAVHRLTQRIAAGLHAAHERGIVHRDVSPDNIIIPGGDMSRAKIIDFGIARSTRLGDDGTVIGSGFAGKYNYVSPEQLGLYGGEVTPRSDIYSLGLVLAESLRSGPVDMGGNHVEVIDKRRQVPDIGPVDSRLRPLLERMLQPNPADRPGSMAEVADWPIGDKTTIRRPAEKVPPAVPRTAPRSASAGGLGKPALIGGIAAALVAVLAGVGFFVMRSPAPVPVPPLPRLDVEQKPSAATPPKTPQTTATENAAEPPAGVKPGLAPMNMGKLAEVRSDTRPVFNGQPALDAGQRGRVDAITRYVGQYDGGDCFFVRPVAVNDRAAALEGFGASAAAFNTLDEAFRRSNGFEPDIGVRQVAAGQCPAVTFLGRLRNAAAIPGLDLASPAPKAGDSLRGSVSGLAGRQLDVLIVADDGSVKAVATPPPTRADEDVISFALRLPSDLTPGRLELVVAIASSKPLAILRNARPGTADKLFPQIAAEAERTGQTLAVTARTFKVER